MVEEERFRGQVDWFTEVVGSLFPDRQEEIVTALNDFEERDSLLSSLQSLMFSPPEIRAEKASMLYQSGGLRELLKSLDLNDEERRSFINGLAGEEVARPKR